MSTDAANKRRRVGEDGEAGDAAGGGGPGVVSMEAFAEMKAEMALMKEQMNEMQRQSREEQERLDGRINLHSGVCDKLVGTSENTIVRVSSMRADIDRMNDQLAHVHRLEDKCESQERKIKYLEARCDLLMRTGAMLLKDNEEWYYSAPHIYANDLIARGFDRPYRVRMRSFLDGIKRATTLMRKSGNTSHKFSLGDELGEDEAALLCDDSLLPHWNEFADALQISQAGCDRFHDLSICGVQLSPAVMTVMAPALMMKGIHSLELESNEFNGREGIQFAIDCVENNTSLESFHWECNTIARLDDCHRLIRGIADNSLTKSVTLVNCFGEGINAYEMLCMLIASNEELDYLNLQANAIRTAGGTQLPDFLATNPAMGWLLLTNNNLNDDDTILIARALKQNTNLQWLGLGRNDITDTGRNALRNAIFDPRSLNHVSDSNHTCNITGLNFGDIIPENASGQRQQNRRCKIFTLLSSRNRERTNVQHLSSEFEDDSSSKLVPRVLECVRKHSRYELRHFVEPEKPLSILYEILRGWKMPSLYDNARATSIE